MTLRRPVLWGLALGSVVALVHRLGLLESLELKTVNHRFVIRGAEEPRFPIVLVTVDEESFDNLHLRWPCLDPSTRGSWMRADCQLASCSASYAPTTTVGSVPIIKAGFSAACYRLGTCEQLSGFQSPVAILGAVGRTGPSEVRTRVQLSRVAIPWQGSPRRLSKRGAS